MSKILINNTTGSVFVTDMGRTVPVPSYTLIPEEYPLWATSNDVITLIGNGTFTVNDGSYDLSISDGVDHIKGYFPRKIQIYDYDSGYSAEVTDENELKVTTRGGDADRVHQSALDNHLHQILVELKILNKYMSIVCDGELTRGDVR